MINSEYSKIHNILNKNNANVVITGDSLAVNHYGFDTEFRLNAFDCYPGILSWSFMVRDAIYQNEKWYVFGDEICFIGCNAVKGGALLIDETGIGNKNNKYRCLNHGKVSTLIIDNSNQVVEFSFSHENTDSGTATLYLQKRPDIYACTFDIYLDGELIVQKVINYSKY
jgi:hypothetical protein